MCCNNIANQYTELTSVFFHNVVELVRDLIYTGNKIRYFVHDFLYFHKGFNVLFADLLNRIVPA